MISDGRHYGADNTPGHITTELFKIKMSKAITTCAYLGADSSLVRLGNRIGKEVDSSDEYHDQKYVKQ